jgi:hypothetical protein
MREISAKFRELGGEVYVNAVEVKKGDEVL